MITTGTHNWLVTSRTEDGDTVIATVMETRDDSVSESRYARDSIRCARNTSFFTIVIADSTINLDFSWKYPYGINKIPRYLTSNNDTLTVWWTNYSTNEKFTYVSSTGLTRIDYVTMGNNPFSETMVLRGFHKP